MIEYVFQFCNFRAPDPETEDATIPVEDLPQYVWTALFFAVTSSCFVHLKGLYYSSHSFGRARKHSTGEKDVGLCPREPSLNLNLALRGRAGNRSVY